MDDRDRVLTGAEAAAAYTNHLRRLQRQDSLTDQLLDLRQLARREGLYDADDWIAARMAQPAAAPRFPTAGIDPTRQAGPDRQGHAEEGR